jgi:peptidoglycan/xylan/chitin deacetylase (PgdA/CDA1 family)
MGAVRRTLSIWRRKAEYAYHDALSLTGIHPRLFSSARGSRIVVYHGLCEQDHLRFNNIFLLRKTFEAHLRFFKEHFHVVSLDDYYQQRFNEDRLNICIHFDDGYANQLHYVLPLLEQYQLPASFFITAIREAGYNILWNDFLGLLNRYGPEELVFHDEPFRKQQGLFPSYVSILTGTGLMETLMPQGFGPKAELIREFSPLIPLRETEDYWLQLTTDEIRTLAASPWVTIGAHGYYHNDLSKILLADAEQEMLGCKRFLESLTGREVNALAFPYGRYTAAVAEAAKKTGFNQLLPLKITYPDDAMCERLIINPYVSVTNGLLNVIKKRYDGWR